MSDKLKLVELKKDAASINPVEVVEVIDCGGEVRVFMRNKPVYYYYVSDFSYKETIKLLTE